MSCPRCPLRQLVSLLRKKKNRPNQPDSRAGDSDLHIACLPNEIMLQILGWLQPRDLGCASRVCRAWRLLCNTALLWREAEASFNSLFLSRPALENLKERRVRQFRVSTSDLPACLQTLASHFPDMRRLALREYGFPSARALLSVEAPGLSLLRELDLGLVSAYLPSYFRSFLEQLPCLRILSLRGRYGDDLVLCHRDLLIHLESLHLSSRSITDAAITSLVDANSGSASSLRRLGLSQCSGLTPAVSQHVLFGFPGLAEFEIEDCRGITIFDFDFLAWTAPAQDVRVSVSFRNRPSVLTVVDGEPRSLEFRALVFHPPQLVRTMRLCFQLSSLTSLRFYGLCLSESLVLNLVICLRRLRELGLYAYYTGLLADIEVINRSVSVVMTGYR